MVGKIATLALAAASLVNAGPLVPRQASSAASAASSAVSSAVSSALANVTSSASSASSSASSAASSGSSAAAGGASSASSSAAAATSTGNATTGNQSYPLYPCPTGYLLTYVDQNATVPLPLAEVSRLAGNWSSSPLFGNVTTQQGGNMTGATNTIDIEGISLSQVLVSDTVNATTGTERWIWNLTSGPVNAGSVSISNYSAVLTLYDDALLSNGTHSNVTSIDLYINFCASQQAAGISVVQGFLQYELGLISAAASGNSTAGSTSSSSSSAPASSSSSSAASSTTSRASSAVSSAASGASSVASAISSAVASAAGGASSAAASATSSA